MYYKKSRVIREKFSYNTNKITYLEWKKKYLKFLLLFSTFYQIEKKNSLTKFLLLNYNQNSKNFLAFSYRITRKSIVYPKLNALFETRKHTR